MTSENVAVHLRFLSFRNGLAVSVKMQTLPQALEWVWQGHAVDTKLKR